MTTRVKELMHTDLVTLSSEASVRDAARRMRDSAIGDVLVADDGHLRGIVTDRDLVVRCLAEEGDVGHTHIGDLCSSDLVTLTPDDDIDTAIRLMSEKAIRRLPVVDGDRPVGIVSIGDLAVARDRHTALGDISAAPPSH